MYFLWYRDAGKFPPHYLIVLTFSLFLFSLHEVLMDLQQKQLQQLSDWLTQTEERIVKIETEPAAKDVELYKEQIENHKVNPT